MHRKALRDAVRAALAVEFRFWAATILQGWAQGADGDALPVIGVSTPREQSAAEDKDCLRRTVDLSVMLKREGDDDIEDVLDADAQVIEAAVLTAIAPLCLYAEISETRMDLNGDGARRIGRLMLTFTCLIHTETGET